MLKEFAQFMLGLNQTGKPVDVKDHHPLLIQGTSITGVEEYAVKPYRVKAKQSFASLAAFMAYINAFKQETTAIIGSTSENGMKANFEAIMDYHGRPTDKPADADAVVGRGEASPEWADHRALFDAPLDPDFKAWLGIDGREMDQAEMYAWCVDYQANFITPHSATVLAVVGHLKIVGELDASSNVQGGGVDTLIRETMKLKSGHSSDGVNPDDLPEVWEVSLPVFKGMPARYVLPFRLLWRKCPRHGAQLRFKLVRPHLLIEAAFNDAAAKIRETTGVEVFGEDASKVSKPATTETPAADAKADTKA